MLRHVWVLAFLLQVLPAWAEVLPSTLNPDGTSTTELGEADHDTLRKLMVDATAALNDLDSATLVKYLAEGFVLTFADQTVVTDPAQLDGYIAHYFTGENAPLKSVNFVPEATEKVRFIDSRTGVVYGTSADTYTLADDKNLVLDTHWTATVIKEDGHWLVQTFHAGVNMLDNPILEATSQGGLISGGIALIVGLVTGAFLMRIFRRS
jgi:hypothetical protein